MNASRLSVLSGADSGTAARAAGDKAAREGLIAGNLRLMLGVIPRRG